MKQLIYFILFTNFLLLAHAEILINGLNRNIDETNHVNLVHSSILSNKLCIADVVMFDYLASLYNETEKKTTRIGYVTVKVSEATRIKVIERLLVAGANLNDRSKDSGLTPLDAAAKFQYDEISKYLVNQTNGIIQTKDTLNSALIYAKYNKNIWLVARIKELLNSRRSSGSDGVGVGATKSFATENDSKGNGIK